MAERPTLYTRRLILRPLMLSDAPDVQRLAGDRAIADTTLNIPHPYEDDLAEAWISKHPDLFAKGEGLHFAIALRDHGTLLGAAGLTCDERFSRAELGYWIGKPYWNQGYCTEAARAVVAHAFETMGLHRITAHYLQRNPASGRIMEKLGMIREGVCREHVKKWDQFEDVVIYGILRREWEDGA